jgi:hypothetical protein
MPREAKKNVPRRFEIGLTDPKTLMEVHKRGQP